MKRLSYVDRSIITADRVSDAVIEYAQLLALRSRSDVVTVPAFTADNEATSVDMLIGPASQLIAEPVPDEVELDIEEFLVELSERVERLRADSFVPFHFSEDTDTAL